MSGLTIGSFSFPLVLSVLFVGSSQINYLLFHTLVELFTVGIGILTFILAWYAHPFSRNGFLLVLGTGYLWISALDLVHAITYDGLGLIPDHAAAVTIEYWIIARFFEAILLVFAPFALQRSPSSRKVLLLFALLFSIGLALPIWGWFPVCFVPGVGLTAFKIYSEYLIIGLMVIALIHLQVRQEGLSRKSLQLTSWAILSTIGAELCFTAYVGLFDLANLLGHVFKFFSFWFLFMAIVRTGLQQPFRLMARNSSTYDAVPNPLVVVDSQGVIRQANRSAYQLSGMGSTELIGKSCHEVFHDSSIGSAKCAICRAIAAGERVSSIEVPFRSGKWFEFALTPIRASRWDLEGLVHFRREITKRKELERELRGLNQVLQERITKRTEALNQEVEERRNAEKVANYNERRFRSLFEHMGNGVAIFNAIDGAKDFLIVDFNRAAEEIAQVKRSEVLGQRLTQAFPGINDSGLLEIFSLVHQTGVEAHHPESLYQDEKRYLWVENDIYKLPSGEVVAIFSDKTEQKLAELSLQESEERFRQLAEHIKEVFWIHDALDGQLVYVSPAYEDIWGRSVKSLLSSPEEWIESIHSDDRERVRGALGNNLAEYDELYRIVRPDGGIRWIQDRGFPIFSREGELIRVAGFASDVTQMKEDAVALERAKVEADRANRAKSSFLASMSHEIRSPMNAVIGMTDLLLTTSVDDDQRRYLEIVHNSSHSLLGLLNDLLDFSKIEAGKVVLDKIDFDPQELMEQACETHSVLAAEKGLDIWLNIDPVVPMVLEGDPGRLRQILVNMIGNAVKFTHQGEITVSMRLMDEKPPWDGLTVSEYSEPVMVEFSVSDTGIGISEKELTGIFDPFVQTRGSSGDPIAGTGLGLAICQNLSQLMGGRTWAESVQGEGSRFSFSVCLGVFPSAPLEAYFTRQMAIPERKILVVVPSEIGRHSIYRILSVGGATVKRVASVDESLDCIGVGDHWDLLIIDETVLQEGKEWNRLREGIRQGDGKILLLCRTGDEPRFRDEIDATFYKPIRRLNFIEVLNGLIGQVGESVGELLLEESVDIGRGRGSLRVLVVDDNVNNRILVTEILKRAGHTSVEAREGREAISCLEKEPFDIVLIDNRMPVLNGVQATRIIRSGRVKGIDSAIPIICVTANVMPDDRRGYSAVGMDGVIAKPFSAGELLSSIWWTIDRKRVEAESPQREGIGKRKESVLIAGSDPDLHKRRLEFVAGLGERLDRIKVECGGGDREQLRELIGGLRQEASEVQAELLQRALFRVLIAVRSEDGDRIDQALRQLKREVEKLRRFVNSQG
ncbi:MASE3 domain-containing protein [Magnetococcales bacterium HHB-1]